MGHRAFEIGVLLAPYVPLKVPCRARTGTAQARREGAHATGCVSGQTQALGGGEEAIRTTRFQSRATERPRGLRPSNSVCC